MRQKANRINPKSKFFDKYNPTTFPRAMTDLEWGTGFALMGINQMASVSGRWDIVKDNFEETAQKQYPVRH